MRFRQSSGALRRALYLVLFALALSSCVSSPTVKSARFIESGKKLLAGKDAPRAILAFKNAIKAVPKNPEAYYQLSLAYLAAGDLQSAVKCLVTAIQLDPKHTAARLELAQLESGASDQGALQDADRRLQALLQEKPDNPDALHALALTELKMGDTAEAMRHLDMAIAAAPQELMIAITLAQAKLEQKDPKGAEAILLKACQSSPKSVDAVVVLGEFYFSQNKTAEAEQQFHRALSMDPNFSGAWLNLGTLQDQMGRKQEAEQSFKRLSGMPDFKQVYGIFLFEQGRKDEALREFERLYKENPDDRMIRTRLVALYRSANRGPDAEKVLSQALKKNGRDLDALLQRGEMYLAGGKYEQAEGDLNRVVQLKPDSAELRYVLAKLYQARGSEGRYKQEMAKALELNPFLLPVRLEFAQSLLARNNAQAALDVLDGAPQGQKQSIPVLVERNWALWSLGNLAEMRKGIDQGLERARSADLLIQDGLWRLRAGDPARARVAIEEALKIDPADLRALLALRQTYIAQKNAPMALEIVKEFAGKNPKSAPIQHFFGLLLMAHGDVKQAQVAFAAAVAADPGFREADLALVQTDVLQGKADDARKRLKAILSRDEGNPKAQLWLGILEEKLGDRNAAIDLYRKVAQANPDSAQASNNLAYLLAEYGNKPDEALRYAEKAVELVPEDPAYCDTLGWILYRKGVYDSAIPYLERASAHEAKDTVIWKYHLAMAYAKAGNVTRGRTTLEAALKLNPNLPEAKIAQQVVDASH
jgi:Tfp pilus assembly protein PilF